MKNMHAKGYRQDHLKKIKAAIEDYVNSALIDYSFSIKYDSHTGGITIYQDCEDVVIEMGGIRKELIPVYKCDNCGHPFSNAAEAEKAYLEGCPKCGRNIDTGK